VTRSEDATRPKRAYLVAPSVRELLLADRKGQLKVMSTGVKTFERQDSKVTTHTDQQRPALTSGTKVRRMQFNG